MGTLLLHHTELHYATQHVKAVALLEQMGERRIQPDEVCYGATIAALSEAAGTQTRSTWGASGPAASKVVAPPRGTSWASAEGEDRGDDGTATTAGAGAAVSGGKDGSVVPTRAHEKALALMEQMRRDGPR